MQKKTPIKPGTSRLWSLRTRRRSRGTTVFQEFVTKYSSLLFLVGFNRCWRGVVARFISHFFPSSWVRVERWRAALRSQSVNDVNGVNGGGNDAEKRVPRLHRVPGFHCNGRIKTRQQSKTPNTPSSTSSLSQTTLEEIRIVQQKKRINIRSKSMWNHVNAHFNPVWDQIRYKSSRKWRIINYWDHWKEYSVQ